MNETLKNLLEEVLDSDTFKTIVDNFEVIKNEKIVSSGIDSLEYISLLSELDERYSFDDERIDSLETIDDLNNLFKEL